MRHVGLCIVYRNNNYGSILQSYATLLKLRSLGCECEIIRYTPKKDAKFYIKSIPRLRSRDMVYGKVRAFKRIVGKVLHKDYKVNDSIRAKKFRQFVDQNFGTFSNTVDNYESLKRLAANYSDVIVGSDQLWLPSGLDTNFYNLMFVPDNINKIAYSASFGVSSIPGYQVKKTKAYLQRIDHLSVREESGARIIKALTDRDAAVILDPTMIIGRKAWDESIPNEAIVEGDYIFSYFLGNNLSHRKAVNELAKAKNLKIVYLRHLDEYIPADECFGDVAPYDIGPAEFVNLIRHAKYVCTDSFHGSVFSIIYHKQFVSFNRYEDGKNSRNGRLDTLFHNIGLSRRYDGNLISQIDQEINWEHVDQRLLKLQEKSSQFIEGALSGEQ